MAGTLPGVAADSPAVRSFDDALIVAIPRLRRLAHRIASPPVDPEDLLQDALERAWRSRDTFRDDATITTWLYRILVNRAVDLHRLARSLPVPNSEGDLAGPADPAGIDVVDPVAVLERAADIAQLRAALTHLAPGERTVLALHDGEGWTARLIGEVLDLPPGTVHKRVQRARLRLLRALTVADGPARPPSEHCHRTRGNALAYLDGTLDDPTRRLVEDHIAGCARCPSLVQALLGLPDTLRRAPGPDGPVAALRRALATGEHARD
jgi:RNA polymerase sigma-70 factor (ECF subfamily)